MVMYVFEGTLTDTCLFGIEAESAEAAQRLFDAAREDAGFEDWVFDRIANSGNGGSDFEFCGEADARGLYQDVDVDVTEDAREAVSRCEGAKERLRERINADAAKYAVKASAERSEAEGLRPTSKL